MQFIEKMDIDKLKLWEKNPRFNDEAAERLAKVLKKHGFIDPVIIDENNIVRAGNTRVKAAKLAGIKSVPVLIVNFKNEQAAEAYSIADNKANEWAQWDYLGLKEIIDSIGDYDFEDIGFTKEDYEEILTYEEIDNDLKNKSLKEDFLFSPFSVLDGRTGEWLERKKQWLSLGIKSELGRENNLVFSDSLNKYGKAPKNEKGEIINTSIFDPVIAELTYKWFCIEGGEILDPFAGGSVRGIVASKLGYKYYGNDLSGEQIKANVENAKEIGIEIPTWKNGDSRNIDKLFENKEFDLIFTCPPYVNLEKYSDDPRDLSNMNYDNFIISFKEIIEKSCNMLKKDRFAVIVVGDVRDKKGAYYNFVSDTKRIFINAGLVLYNELIKIDPVGTASIRSRRYFKNRKVVKVHQNILVFYKGNIKSIPNNFKNIEFPKFITEEK